MTLANELKESDMKSTLHMKFLKSRVPMFHSARSTISRFQDTEHFRTSPLPPMLKF